MSEITWNELHSGVQVRDCAVKMARQEGLLSFWKGILPPVLVETPKRAWKFFTFEQFQKVFLFGSDKPTALVIILTSKYLNDLKNIHCMFSYCLQTYSLAGLGSGVTEAIIVNPFEVVKVGLSSPVLHEKPL